MCDSEKYMYARVRVYVHVKHVKSYVKCNRVLTRLKNPENLEKSGKRQEFDHWLGNSTFNENPR